ncbi:unnamed protein product [Penicillium camemberti]|uniref:Str. FM013 n=1 Tax=Penicillium camemberti (strain FM 013) TaxID=1429867 RepID=A0A0G4P5W2_PENC3|nr:unnamed protein product [Penicillium camemberti]
MVADSELKSFRDIVRNHNRFLVSPLQWTSRHLDLVGSRFEDVATTTVYTQQDRNTDGRNPTLAATDLIQNDTNKKDQEPCSRPLAQSDAEALATSIFPETKRDRLIKILVGKHCAFANISKGPSFFFGGRSVHRPEYIMFHHHKESIDHINNRPPSLLGYVHYTTVNGARYRQFYPCPGPRGATNKVGWSIHRKRLAQTTPEEWTEDPYFVCHLLALAQLQERNLNSSKPITYTSRLLVTNALEREYILFYEAKITTELLSALGNWMDATIPIQWPTIQRKKIPYKPYDTFDSRLKTELGETSTLPSHSL